MKKNILSNFLGHNHVGDDKYGVENSIKTDFSHVNSLHYSKNHIEDTSEKKSILPSYIILVVLFLFTNFLFAQQPACNLNGVLEAKRLRDGGQNFTINSEVLRTTPGTIYKWEFKSNTSAATFATPTNQPNITINPGNKNGNFNIKLTIINPPDSRGTSKTCSCTKSVSIGNL